MQKAVGPLRLAAFLPVLFACAAPVDPLDVKQSERAQSSFPIVDGTPASLAETYATVAMTTPQGFQFCTGTAIAPRVVVTAAHCVQGSSAASMRVVAGVLDATASSADRRAVSRIVSHPNYGFGGGGDVAGLGNARDIALLILAEPIDDVITPAAILPWDRVDTDLATDTALVITGYGTTSTAANASHGRLYIAEAPWVRRSATEFIAGRFGTPDTCQGDSGGPVYLMRDGRPWLIGATSRGVANSSLICGGGGIYSLVPAFIDWIQNEAGDLYDPAPPEGAQCAACEGDEDCGDGLLCLPGLDGTSTCTAPCEEGADDACASGFACVEGQCLPVPAPACRGGNVVDVDGCGAVSDVVEECPAGRCDAGACVPPPAGDTCEAAETLAATTGTVTGTLTGYANHSKGSCGGNGPERSYALTLDVRSRVVLTTTGFDTVLYLRAGCDGAQVACNDDANGGLGSRIEATLDPGTYIVFVDAYGQSVGSYTLSVAVTPE